jgi:hypothetical protein
MDSGNPTGRRSNLPLGERATFHYNGLETTQWNPLYRHKEPVNE